MKDFMKIVLYCFLTLVLVASLSAGVMAINGTLYPWWLSIQRRSVEQSKSFTDANNNMLQTYMLEYQKLDTKIVEANGNEDIIKAYKAQESAIVWKMCTQVSTMATGTVNPNTTSWLNSHGGCR